MQISDLFERDVKRPIPPVVYFHEQTPEALQREVEEYIITGGYPPGDPRATSEGIHEQFVHLLRSLKQELKKTGGPDLPACWISGFYGSGKSSFAKLLGLALDGQALPDKTLLSKALLSRDHSPDSAAFRMAWQSLLDGIEPLAVVFDVGAQARDDEQIHAVAVRQIQKRLGYCATSSLVADYELRLESDSRYEEFEAKVLEVHGKPWERLKDSQLAEDHFSSALHALNPRTYPDPLAWVNSRSGSAYDGKRSADEAVSAIDRMLSFRAKGRTLFLVVDEVSQYVHEDEDRMLALQSFVEALGQRLRGRAWILATGQQKLEEGAGVSTAIVKLKGRFPTSLRVHLGNANIREVVYRRLLKKKKALESDLRELFDEHRADLALHGWQGDEITKDAFVEIYPLLPGHIDLLLRITTGLRAQGARVQGDAHEIRGLLQLLGDIFREQDFVSREPGWLITIDRVYDILHTALATDLHMTINRALEFSREQESELMARVVKAVAMLELIQDEKHPTTAELISRALYARLGQGNQLAEVQKALDALVGEGCVTSFAKTGYKIESSAGQEWQNERDGYVPGNDLASKEIQNALDDILRDVDKVNVKGLPLSWLALFTDSYGAKEVHVHDERKPTSLCVDFQLTKGEGRDEWIPRSSTASYRHRFVWVVGEQDAVQYASKKLIRSNRMVERYGGRSVVDPDRQRLLIEERNNGDASRRELAEAVKSAFLAGKVYFQGSEYSPRNDGGHTFVSALSTLGSRFANVLYPNPIGYTVTEKEIEFLFEKKDLSAPPPVFGQEKLGLLTLDAGRYEVTCTGEVPNAVLAYVSSNGGVAGSNLIAHFGGPPHGLPSDIIRAVVIGLLRARKIRVDISGVSADLTSVQEEGARELLKDGGLRKARLSENTDESISPRDKNAICTFFKEQLGKDVARDHDSIANAVAEYFPVIRGRLTEIDTRLHQLPKSVQRPESLSKLEVALETCRKNRQVEPIVLAVKRSLVALREGLTLLRRIESDLTPNAVQRINEAHSAWIYQWPHLDAVGASEKARTAASAIAVHLKVQSPWEDIADLDGHVATIEKEYRERRRGILEVHGQAVDAAVERVKRRDGFEALDASKRHLVLQHLTEGASAGTDERAIAPALEALESMLAARLEQAEQKAIRQLDELRTESGGTPIVEIALGLEGREIETEQELDRLLEDIRSRVMKDILAKHRVRFRGS